MAIHEVRRLALSPLPALVLVIPNQFLLLRIHGDDRSARGDRPADVIVDVLELRSGGGGAARPGTPDPSGSDRCPIQRQDVLGYVDQGSSIGGGIPRDAPIAIMH